MKVTNLNGTSDNKCSCGSWLDHWRKFSGQTVPTYCPEQKCTKKPTVGAHVQKSGSNSWYIVPLCDDHNKLRGQDLEITSSVALVSANKAETCGKAK
jgi:hypothetical protein